MPLNLGGEIHEIVAALLTFKQQVEEPSKDLKTDLEALLRRLGSVIRGLNGVFQALSDDKLTDDKPKPKKKLLEDRNARAAAVTAIEQQIVSDEGVSLETFFNEVGRAVKSAQHKLDQHALADLEEPSESRIPPVQYAIPNVKAEIKVGFSLVSSKGINVVVFQNSLQKNSYSESTVSFEIVAAPLPPRKDALKPKPPDALPAPTPSAAPAPAVGGLSMGLEATVDDEATAVSFDAVAAVPAEPAFTFPLTGEARTLAIDRLAALLDPEEAEHLATARDRVAVVPSRATFGPRVALVFLCPGVRARRSKRSQRAFRCYLADYDPPSTMALRPIRRPSVAPPQSGPALVLPTAPASMRDPQVLAEVVGGVGTVLMQIVLGARTFEPEFLLDTERDAVIVNRLRRRFRKTALSLADDVPWVVFRDGQAEDEATEYIVLRPTVVPGTEEWQEFHIASVSSAARTPSVPPHLHIPSAETIDEWRTESPENLVLLVKDCERFLRRLTEMLVHVSR